MEIRDLVNGSDSFRSSSECTHMQMEQDVSFSNTCHPSEGVEDEVASEREEEHEAEYVTVCI